MDDHWNNIHCASAAVSGTFARFRAAAEAVVDLLVGRRPRWTAASSRHSCTPPWYSTNGGQWDATPILSGARLRALLGLSVRTSSSVEDYPRTKDEQQVDLTESEEALAVELLMRDLGRLECSCHEIVLDSRCL